MKRATRNQIVGDLFILGGWGLLKGTIMLTRALVTMTGAVLPAPSSPARAITQAVLGGCIWGIAICTVTWGLSGVAEVSLTIGAIIDVLITWALVEAGQAQSAIQSGTGVTVGEGNGRFGEPQPYVISRESRVRHLAIFGPTGSGKSTVLKHLVWQDAAAPSQPGVLCIDVKDDLVLDIAARMPSRRVSDVLLFDAADSTFPPAFNPLVGVPPEARTLAASEILSALKRLYEDAWGPRLEHVLRAAILTLLETPDATLLDVVRLLTDPRYRAWALGYVTNFSLHGFWDREFPAITGTRGSLANVESILNKLGVLNYPEMRNVLGQTGRGLNLRAAIDQGKIVLAHIPQGVLGEDASHFLAALLVGKAQLATQSRVTLSAAQRRPFYIFADEFQTYETSAMDKLLTEGRSMGVGLTVACQFPEQLPTHLRLAVERNCAHAVYCRLRNGKHLADIVKLQEPDAKDATRVVRTSPPQREATTGQLLTIRAQSRAALAQPRADVERSIYWRFGFGVQRANASERADERWRKTRRWEQI